MKSVNEVLSDSDCRLALLNLLKAAQGKDAELIKESLGEFLGTLEEAEPEISLPVVTTLLHTVKEPGKRTRRTKAQMAAARLEEEKDASKPLTAKEIAVAKQNESETPDQEAVVKRCIEEVIKPNAHTVGADGFRHFYVNLVRHGQNVPTSGHKWIAGLKAAGIALDEKLFTCIIAGNGVPAGQMKISF